MRAGRDAHARRRCSASCRESERQARLLDAGCGTGALSVEAAGAARDVVAVDLSPTLVAVARERLPARRAAGSIEFRVGDMLDAGLGRFDHVVAMDSLIHYRRRGHGAHPGGIRRAHRALDPVHVRAETAAADDHADARPALPARRSRAGDRAVAERTLRRRWRRERALAGWRLRPHAAHHAAAFTSPRPWSSSGDEPNHRDH